MTRVRARARAESVGAWSASLVDAQALQRDGVERTHDRLCVGIPEPDLEVARVLISELVTNSVLHGPTGEGSILAVFIRVGRDRLRVEVSDGSPRSARPKTPSPDGGYGLALAAELASRWGAGHENGLNVTWFELVLPLPGDRGRHVLHSRDASASP